jgi:hypothetical protein
MAFFDGLKLLEEPVIFPVRDLRVVKYVVAVVVVFELSNQLLQPLPLWLHLVAP